MAGKLIQTAADRKRLRIDGLAVLADQVAGDAVAIEVRFRIFFGGLCFLDDFAFFILLRGNRLLNFPNRRCHA